jgi:Fur family ferric uptake transcriptional regulator
LHVQNRGAVYDGVMIGKDHDASVLKEAGLRATPQRRAVLAVLRSRSQPLSVEEVVAAGKGKFDTTTAYRTLEALEEKGVVRKLAVDQGRATFEMADEHHHHAVCVSCGSIRDVAFCINPSLDEAVRKEARFSSIARHSLEFFGTCQTCARTSSRKSR